MGSFLHENTINFLWHAFAALDTNNSGIVPKSKLKVLTSNMASIMGLYGLEQGLEHFRSTSGLNFENYQYYLGKEVFSAVTDELSPRNVREYELKIAKLCWLVCCRKHLTRKGVTLSEDSMFKLFVIFCMSSELKARTGDFHQVVLHPSEVIHIAQLLTNSLGCSWDENEFIDVAVSIGLFQFDSFVAVLETRCFATILAEEAVGEAISDLYEIYVEDVVKKGFLSKKVNTSLPIMKEYWFVLKLSALEYFKSKTDKTCCGCMALESDLNVKSKDGNRFIIKSGKRKIELQAKDPITRLQWLSALKVANDNSSHPVRTTKDRIERQQRFDEQIQIQREIYREKRSRQNAEKETAQIKMMAIEESKRLSELEQLKENLERLLVEAAEAKRSEEIVRSLQARVLAEEWERREELEKLQREQKEKLEQEVTKRKESEGIQLEKELQLQAAEKLLHQLEEEKLGMDSKLQNALDKIQKIEQHKQLLESKLIQVASFLEGSKVRRTHSFMPTTKERPIVLEIRAAATLLKP